jgi:proteasome lid subunit RPN8/RPN11
VKFKISSEKDIMGQERWNKEKSQHKEIIPKGKGQKIIIAPWIINYIKKHAQNSPNEIYGWLVGRESFNNDLYIFSVFACENYQIQNEISAAPNPRELQELGSILPQGVGIVGIYHSHPSDVFHSSVDDLTIQNLSKYYNNIISAVTNSDGAIKWFQLDKTHQITQEIEIYGQKIPDNLFQTLKYYGNFQYDFKISVESSLIQQLIGKFLDNFNSAWDNSSIDILGEHQKKKGNLEDINRIEISNLTEKSLRKLIDPKNSVRFNLNFNSNSDKSMQNSVHSIKFQGKLRLLVDILFDKQDLSSKSFDILEVIKDEFRDELIQTLSNGIFKIVANNLKILIPQPVIMPYSGISPKSNIHLENVLSLKKKTSRVIDEFTQKFSELQREYFPILSQIILREDGILSSMVKRANILKLIDKKNESNELLKLIKGLYKIRGQEKDFKGIQTNIKNNKIL